MTSHFTKFVACLVVFFGLLLLFFCFVAPAAEAQSVDPMTVQTAVVYPFITDSARAQLELAWDDTNPNQVERGYCVTAFDEMESSTENGAPGVDRWIKVTGIAPAITASASSRSTNFSCPTGQPTLHTHPPTTCDADHAHCVIGGVGAYECAPSRADLMSVIGLGDNWGIIQCDKHAFRFFYPFELRLLRPSKGS